MLHHIIIFPSRLFNDVNVEITTETKLCFHNKFTQHKVNMSHTLKLIHICFENNNLI
jgi:hypothetical protein